MQEEMTLSATSFQARISAPQAAYSRPDRADFRQHVEWLSGESTVEVAVGNRTFMRSLGIVVSDTLLAEREHRREMGQICSFIAVDQHVKGLLVLEDVPRPELAQHCSERYPALALARSHPGTPSAPPAEPPSRWRSSTCKNCSILILRGKPIKKAHNSASGHEHYWDKEDLLASEIERVIHVLDQRMTTPSQHPADLIPSLALFQLRREDSHLKNRSCSSASMKQPTSRWATT